MRRGWLQMARFHLAIMIFRRGGSAQRKDAANACATACTLGEPAKAASRRDAVAGRRLHHPI
jgi:hypothetical protein